MPTQAKMAAVAALKEDLSSSTAAIVADYRGLTVSDISAVRRALRGEGITCRVVKNRLAKIAATEAGRGELNELLEGPTALAIGRTDEVTLARTFLDAIRPFKTVVVRGAIIGEKRIDAASVTRLSTLPSREVLLAQLAGGMASPLAKMASLFSAPLRNLGYALSQLAQNKGQQEATPEPVAKAVEAPAETPATAVAEPQTAEAPEAEAAAEAPGAEATAEAPEAEATAEAPEAEATAEAPEAEATAEAPEAEASEPESSPAEAGEAEAETAQN
jgi:large subunit ribosomal protein L10